MAVLSNPHRWASEALASERQPPRLLTHCRRRRRQPRPAPRRIRFVARSAASRSANRQASCVDCAGRRSPCADSPAIPRTVCRCRAAASRCRCASAADRCCEAYDCVIPPPSRPLVRVFAAYDPTRGSRPISSRFKLKFFTNLKFLLVVLWFTVILYSKLGWNSLLSASIMIVFLYIINNSLIKLRNRAKVAHLEIDENGIPLRWEK